MIIKNSFEKYTQVNIMATGIVKWFNARKGFGFITPDEGDKDVFVHHTGIVTAEGEFANLNENDKVEYEVQQGEKGLEAKQVKVTEAAPYQPRERRDRY